MYTKFYMALHKFMSKHTKKGTTAFHYSLDGEHFPMTRYFLMKDVEFVKVGLLAQAPTGQGGDRIYENLSIESKTVKNIRAGE